MNEDKACIIILVLILVFIFIHKIFKTHRQKDKILFKFVFNHSLLTITSMELKKSQFPVSGHIAPSTDSGQIEDVDSIDYVSSNENVVTVTKDTTDPKKFTLDFVGDGTSTITATADADLGEGVVTLTDSLEVTAIEDQATKLNMALDV